MTPGVWILVTVRGHVSHTVEMNYFFNKKSTCFNWHLNIRDSMHTDFLSGWLILSHNIRIYAYQFHWRINRLTRNPTHNPLVLWQSRCWILIHIIKILHNLPASYPGGHKINHVCMPFFGYHYYKTCLSDLG